MNRSISVALAALAIATSLLSAQPKQLGTFSELREALNGGWRVRAVIDYAKCKLLVDGEEQESPPMIGGMDFSSYEYYAPDSTANIRAYVVTSETVPRLSPWISMVTEPAARRSPMRFRGVIVITDWYSPSAGIAGGQAVTSVDTSSGAAWSEKRERT